MCIFCSQNSELARLSCLTHSVVSQSLFIKTLAHNIQSHLSYLVGMDTQEVKLSSLTQKILCKYIPSFLHVCVSWPMVVVLID